MDAEQIIAWALVWLAGWQLVVFLIFYTGYLSDGLDDTLKILAIAMIFWPVLLPMIALAKLINAL